VWNLFMTRAYPEFCDLPPFWHPLPRSVFLDYGESDAASSFFLFVRLKNASQMRTAYTASGTNRQMMTDELV
jgi:hypothetical protein